MLRSRRHAGGCQGTRTRWRGAGRRRRRNLRAGQRPLNLGKHLLVSLGQQLALEAAAFAPPDHAAARHRSGSIIHALALLSWLRRRDVFGTRSLPRPNVRRHILAGAAPAEELTQLQANLEHCTARENATFFGPSPSVAS